MEIADGEVVDAVAENAAETLSTVVALTAHVGVAKDEPDDPLGAVVDRLEKGVFPRVQPEDYSDDAEKDLGEHFLAYQRESDYVELKSYLEAKEAEFMRTTPFDEAVPQQVRKAKFNHLCYYTLCRQFYLEKSLSERTFAHRMEGTVFLPVIAMASVGDRVRAAEGQGILDKVEQRHIADIDKMLWATHDRMEELRGGAFDADSRFAFFAEFVEL